MDIYKKNILYIYMNMYLRQLYFNQLKNQFLLTGGAAAGGTNAEIEYCKRLADRICDALVAAKKLKEKPKFFRQDRHAKMVKLFSEIGLTSPVAFRDNFSTNNMINQNIRNYYGQARTESAPIWVDDLIGELINIRFSADTPALLLAPDAGAAAGVAGAEAAAAPAPPPVVAPIVEYQNSIASKDIDKVDSIHFYRRHPQDHAYQTDPAILAEIHLVNRCNTDLAVARGPPVCYALTGGPEHPDLRRHAQTLHIHHHDYRPQYEVDLSGADCLVVARNDSDRYDQVCEVKRPNALGRVQETVGHKGLYGRTFVIDEAACSEYPRLRRSLNNWMYQYQQLRNRLAAVGVAWCGVVVEYDGKETEKSAIFSCIERCDIYQNAVVLTVGAKGGWTAFNSKTEFIMNDFPLPEEFHKVDSFALMLIARGMDGGFLKL